MIEDDGLSTPNCPSCLIQMEVAGEGDSVHWRCSQCGLVKVY